MGKIERIVQKFAFDTKELIGHIKELEILYPKRAGLIDELTGAFSQIFLDQASAGSRAGNEVQTASQPPPA
jgi:hypothetical protein